MYIYKERDIYIYTHIHVFAIFSDAILSRQDIPVLIAIFARIKRIANIFERPRSRHPPENVSGPQRDCPYVSVILFYSASGKFSVSETPTWWNLRNYREQHLSEKFGGPLEHEESGLGARDSQASQCQIPIVYCPLGDHTPFTFRHCPPLPRRSPYPNHLLLSPPALLAFCRNDIILVPIVARTFLTTVPFTFLLPWLLYNLCTAPHPGEQVRRCRYRHSFCTFSSSSGAQRCCRSHNSSTSSSAARSCAAQGQDRSLSRSMCGQVMWIIFEKGRE